MQYMRAGGAAEDFGPDRSWKVSRTNGDVVGFKPNCSFDIVTTEYRNTAVIDELAGRRVVSDKRPTRVLPYLGDSFTLGLGVDIGETFVDHLKAAFKPAFSI